MRLTFILLAVLSLAAPVGAQPRDEQLQFPAGGAILAGTLTLPQTKPRAVAVMIQGAGPHARDQVISGAPMFKELANHLAERGIASVRIDNSGVGASTGQRVASFRQRVPQIATVLNSVAERAEFKSMPIGIIAHSEGTLVATELWPEHNETIDFMILLGAPGQKGRTVWVDQQANPLRFPGKNKAALAAIRASLEAVADASIAGDRTAIASAADRLFAVTGLGSAEVAEIRTGFIDRMASAEMQTMLSSDPATGLSKVTDPVLAVWGALDQLTAPAANAKPLLEQTGESKTTVVVLPEEDHFFLRGDGLAPGKHQYGKMHLSPSLAETMDFWLRLNGW